MAIFNSYVKLPEGNNPSCFWYSRTDMLKHNCSILSRRRYRVPGVLPTARKEVGWQLAENDHRNSGFSHEKWVDLSIAMLVITRG